MIDLHKLKHFVTVARTGSYARAAQELHLAQPSVTRSIQALESQLGVKLLERDRGRTGITLTGAGTELVRKATVLLREAEELESVVSGEAGRAKERVAFGLGPMIASVLLTDLLASVMEERPDLVTTVLVGQSDAMFTELLNGEIEFYVGLASPARTSPRIRSRVFARAVPRLLVRAGHPLAGRAQVAVDDIVRYPLVAATAWAEAGLTLGDDFDHRLFEVAVVIDNYAILAELAATTDAVMVSSVAPRGTGLVPLSFPVDVAAHATEMHLFSLAGIGLSPTAEMLAQRLRTAFEAAGREIEDRPA